MRPTGTPAAEVTRDRMSRLRDIAHGEREIPHITKNPRPSAIRGLRESAQTSIMTVGQSPTKKRNALEWGFTGQRLRQRIRDGRAIHMLESSGTRRAGHTFQPAVAKGWRCPVQSIALAPKHAKECAKTHMAVLLPEDGVVSSTPAMPSGVPMSAWE